MKWFRSGPQVSHLSWWGQCILLWGFLLITLSCTGLLGITIAKSFDSYEPSNPELAVPSDSVPGLWLQWDAGWYLAIVHEGYSNRLDAAGFFPLYPLLVSILTRILPLEAEVASVVVSSLSYLVALLFLYKLARLVRNDHGYALHTVLYLGFFPTSFFFIAGYAESLYLALSIISVYLALKYDPLRLSSGIAAGLASATRPVGWLLGIVFLSEYGLRRDFSLKGTIRLLLLGLLTISGTLLFMLYLYSLTGTFTAITDAQAIWKTTRQFPWEGIIDSLALISDLTLLRNNWFLYVLNIFDLLFVLFSISMAVVAVRFSVRNQLRWSLTLYLVVSIVFILTIRPYQVPLSEWARWTAGLFPIYLVMGLLLKDRHRLRVAVWFSSGAMLFLLTAWWATGRWVG